MNHARIETWLYMAVTAITLCACGSNQPDYTRSSPASSASSATSSAEAIVITGALNDTGLYFCVNDLDVNLACPQSLFPNQDGDIGRDALANTGNVTKVGGGVYGFDWTKLASDGTELLLQDLAWSEDGNEASGSRWSCVQDNVTGLLWEVKESDPDHPRYAQQAYTWYNEDPALNGGAAGMVSSPAELCSDSPCNSQHYVTWMNEQGLCGFNDWRMPTVSELMSIAVYSKVIPALDVNYFPNALQPRFFSSQTLAGDPNMAWYVYFSDASVSSTNKSDRSYLRLVRGGNP